LFPLFFSLWVSLVPWTTIIIYISPPPHTCPWAPILCPRLEIGPATFSFLFYAMNSCDLAPSYEFPLLSRYATWECTKKLLLFGFIGVTRWA
jgi:hypothetical protein